MKPDEQRFLLDVYKASLDTTPVYVFGMFYGMQPKLSPRDIINQDDFYMHHKRAWYLLEKWSKKGWYDYGTTLDLGWLTPEGLNKARDTL